MPSSAAPSRIWQLRREVGLRSKAVSSIASSSSEAAGSFSAQAGSTTTWQVAQASEPSHSPKLGTPEALDDLHQGLAVGTAERRLAAGLHEGDGNHQCTAMRSSGRCSSCRRWRIEGVMIATKWPSRMRRLTAEPSR